MPLRRGRALVVLPIAALLALAPLPPRVVAEPVPETYRNPLAPTLPDGRMVDGCADPAVLRGQRRGDRNWYMFCTTALNNQDIRVNHRLPILRSSNLVDWRYVDEALPEPPAWAAPRTGLWAPDVVYSRATDRYYLTFTVTNVDDRVSEPGCVKDSAIGVAVSRSPTGPWQVSDRPLVGPRRRPTGGGAGCGFFSTLDPDVLGTTIGRRGVLYHGSFSGGVHAMPVRLNLQGMEIVGASRMLAINNRYEAPNVVRRRGWYYLFVSATNCCNGPLTGYSVFAGRSKSPYGPFLDRQGVSLLAGRVGGTPVLSMNGSRWVGTGHNSVIRDFGGQWWTVYHAIDRSDPYFSFNPGFTKRRPMIDPLTWIGGWPAVRAGRWASDRSMPAPAAQPGEESRYEPRPRRVQRRGQRLDGPSAEFSGRTLGTQWSWVRRPAASSYGVENGWFRLQTQRAELFADADNASVLTTPAPLRDYVVQTKVSLDVPARGCCFGRVQAGLVLYRGDDRYIKLTHRSKLRTRQTEFAKEVARVLDEYPRYGKTVVGPPADWTWLRIVKERRTSRSGAPEQTYSAYTRQPGKDWVRGGTWVHNLGVRPRIGLVSMGARGFTARFEHLRVWALRPRGR